MKIVWHEGPSAGNPRNSEGSFLRLDDGRILFAYSRYEGDSSHDHGACNIAAIYSSDEGETWSEPRVIVTAAQCGIGTNVMSVSAVRQLDGRCGLYFLAKTYDSSATQLWRALSVDGESFEVSRCELGYPDTYTIVVNDSITRLRDGRLVAPACVPLLGKLATCICLVSEDDGATFNRTRPCVTLPIYNNVDRGMQEPGIIEHEDGVIRLWARTRAGYQYECYSRDGMNTFTPVAPFVSSPCSPLRMRKDPHTGRLFMAYNPISEAHLGPYAQVRIEDWDMEIADYDPYTAGRCALVVRQSLDDGRTWRGYTVIENDRDHAANYPALFFTEDAAMLIGYCYSGKEEKTPLAALRIKKIDLGEISEKIPARQ